MIIANIAVAISCSYVSECKGNGYAKGYTWTPDLSLDTGQWVTPIATLRGHWIEQLRIVAGVFGASHVSRYSRGVVCGHRDDIRRCEVR
jgi:hypothetical protein